MPALNRFLGSDPAMMAGMMLFLIGGGSVGVFLTLAGAGAGPPAIALGAIAAIALTGGLALLVAGFRRRGGLLRRRVSDAERAAYRREHQAGTPERRAGSPRRRGV